MKANELFNMSAYGRRSEERHNNGSYLTPCGLSQRAFNVLSHYGIADRNTGTVDIDKLISAIKNHETVGWRNCGKTTVREYCKWIESQTKESE